MIDNILRVEGVRAKGFGIVPKLVMQDKRLTRDAKAIYSYFCSFAGAGNISFPSIKKICEDLVFGSEDTFRKHFKLLVQYDYIHVEQERNERGLFARNIYTLVEQPNPEKEEVENVVTPSPKNQGTVIEVPSPKFTGTVNHGHRRTGGIKTTGLRSLKTTTKIFKNNNNIKIKKDVVVESKKDKEEGENLSEETRDIIDLLKNIECPHHTYTISDETTVKAIKKAYISKENEFQLDKFIRAVEHIKNTEPQEGYRNIAGALIKARKYNIPEEPIKKVSNLRKWKTRFHLSQSRGEKYSAEELEEVVLRKNSSERISEEKEKDILHKIKML